MYMQRRLALTCISFVLDGARGKLRFLFLSFIFFVLFFVFFVSIFVFLVRITFCERVRSPGRVSTTAVFFVQLFLAIVLRSEALDRAMQGTLFQLLFP